MYNGTLRGAIARHNFHAEEAGHRTEVDDVAPAACLRPSQQWLDCLGKAKRRDQIDRNCGFKDAGVPFAFAAGHILPRIVDQYVELCELRRKDFDCTGFLQKALVVFERGQIMFVVGCSGSGAGNRHSRASVCERRCDTKTDSVGAAGDEHACI